MKIIADSGSSKTDWRIIKEDGSISQLKTSGINAYLITDTELTELLRTAFPDQLTEPVQEIYFYGAGCSTEQNINKIQSALSAFFKTDKIEVSHDLLAAVRASCGQEAGICCILGTGANACYFDGQLIQDQMISLGYLMGDEGSGYYIGKEIIKNYLENEMPPELARKFQNRYPEVNKENVLRMIYKTDYPNRYFAGFFQFAVENQSEKYFYEMISQAFQLFLNKSVLKFKERDQLPIHFVGGVAYHANNIMRRVLEQNKLIPGNFLESPISGLTLYHQKP